MNVIDTLEAAYSLDGDLDSWLRRLLGTVPGFDIVTVYDTHKEVQIRATLIETSSRFANQHDEIAEGNMELPLSLWTAPGGLAYVSLSQRLEQLTCAEESKQLMAKLPWPPRIQDVLGIVAIDPSGNTVILCAPQSEVVRHVRSGVQARWGRAAAHVLAGLRLRDAAVAAAAVTDAAGAGETAYRPDGDAVLEPNGRCVHAEEHASSKRAREALREAARAIDRARGPLRRRDAEEALSIWRGLVAGRWSLVDRFDSDGRRYLIARRNEPAMGDPRGLTLRERQVVAYARLGQANKLIAYTLGLAESTVATHLARALRKLGLDSRVALTRMPGEALDVPRDAPEQARP